MIGERPLLGHKARLRGRETTHTITENDSASRSALRFLENFSVRCPNRTSAMCASGMRVCSADLFWLFHVR